MKSILVIADIPHNPLTENEETTLTRTQMQRIVGARNVIVTVDGGPATGTVNDFDINNAIWEGRIGGTMLN